MAWDVADLTANGLLIVEAASEGPGAGCLRRICLHLGVDDPAARPRIEAAIALAIAEGRASLLVVEPSGGDRRVITVRPAREPNHAILSSEVLAGAGARLDIESLQTLFELSHSEAEVALSLARGASLYEIALGRRVQHETVRGQVKSVLRKVGVANQKELAATLAHLGALAGALTRRPMISLPLD